MIGIILFGFIGCLTCGWLIGTTDKDDKFTKFLAYFMTILMLGLSIAVLFTWKQIIQEHVIFEHYNIVQEEITTTTYKIVLNGV